MKRPTAAAAAFALLACAGAAQEGGGAAGVDPRPPNAPKQRPAFAGQTRAPEHITNVALRIQTVADGLEFPWGLAFLPDGRMLVTERAGRMRIIDTAGQVSDALGGLPAIDVRGQGGLLDVAADPSFITNRTIYWSFAEKDGANGNHTAVARGRLVDGFLPRVDGVRVIFRQTPSLRSSLHFGGRLVFAPDGTLFVTLGERSITAGRLQAQRLDGLLGKIARINADGTVPSDIHSSGAVTPGRRFGRSGIGTCRRPPSTLQPVNCGRSSTGHAAVTRSTSPGAATITAGRRSLTASNTPAARSPAASPQRPGCSSRATTGTR